jgi:hypothetical protein
VHDTSPSAETLWYAFAHEHATIAALERRYDYSEKWIRTRLDEYTLPAYTPTPCTMVAIGDASWIHGVWALVIRDAHRKENVYARILSSETTSAYQEARRDLARQGVHFSAFVGDGRLATPFVFSDIPVQMCHFHQLQIVIRYLTRNPELPAGIELLALIQTLADTDKASFLDAFTLWCTTWGDFLKEKTINVETGKSVYKHRRLRSARTSIVEHIGHLFTFQDHPTLDIPNTTNSLDGSFKKVKLALGVHAGLSRAHKHKLVHSLIRARE